MFAQLQFENTSGVKYQAQREMFMGQYMKRQRQTSRASSFPINLPRSSSRT